LRPTEDVCAHFERHIPSKQQHPLHVVALRKSVQDVFALPLQHGPGEKAVANGVAHVLGVV
jgi:hypothetical protein